MEHLSQHHQGDSSEVTSFSSALSLLPPTVCQMSPSHSCEPQVPALWGLLAVMRWGSPRFWLHSPPLPRAPLPPHDRVIQPWQVGMLREMLPPHAWVGMSQHRPREMRTCWGVMPIHCPLTPRTSSAPQPYLPLPHPLAPSPLPPRLMGFLDMETTVQVPSAVLGSP